MTRCDLCGGEVRVVGHTTMSYVSVAEEKLTQAQSDLAVAREALERIRGYCEHADGPHEELCECSTKMSIYAEKALAKIGQNGRRG